jgi:TetR/AcrR family transcriptional regulator, transcriptional repressor for nem operon
MMNATAGRLLDLAESHMRNAECGGFSFRELAAEAGTTSASVNHYFPTKASMAAAVPRRYGNRLFVAVDRRPEDLLRASRSFGSTRRDMGTGRMGRFRSQTN